MKRTTADFKAMILKAAREAEAEAGDVAPDRHTQAAGVEWPVSCAVGPGLEGAIACESRVGYVNGSRGQLIYRGYSIFDLCAHSTYEEVSYLLLHGTLPTEKQLALHRRTLIRYRLLPHTLRYLLSFPVEEMHPMAALRLGVNLMRQRLTWRDLESARPGADDAIASDEDSIAMDTVAAGL